MGVAGLPDELSDELSALAGTERTGLPPAADIVVIEGAAGMGKTTMLHQLGRRMAGTGAVFLTAAGASTERDIPFSTVGQLFSRPALTADQVARAERLLRDGTFIVATQSAAHDPSGLSDVGPSGLPPSGIPVPGLMAAGPATTDGERARSLNADGGPLVFDWDGEPPALGWAEDPDAAPDGFAAPGPGGFAAPGTGGFPAAGPDGPRAGAGVDGLPASEPGPFSPAAPYRAAATVPTSVFTQLAAILLRVAEHARVVIGVDDVHHADAASLQFLLHLARRPEAAGLVLVLTGYPQPGSPGPYRPRRVPHTELLYSARTRRLRLGPLPTERVTALLTEYYDGATARALADEARRATGGNPRLVRALGEDGRASGRLDGPVFGDAFRQAVLACLHRSGTTGPAEALAVLPPGTPAELHCGLTGLDREAVRLAHDLLRRSGLVEGGRFRRPAIAQAVLSGMGSRAGTALYLR
ncbi:AAA family ATPase, partial [Actinomadura harenae]